MSHDEIAPKLFVSYSWTNPDHEQWVLQLATELRESGINVVFDKWDLREGHDAHAFMEQMVTDSEIEKVILVCDQAYAEKADDRSGGVGTETLIITPEIYANQGQEKFVAVVTERDDDNNPYLPAFYGSRIFIDMSDPGTSSENFERLLRWVFGQPLHVKPPLGSKPAFLADEERSIVLATSSRYARAIDAMRTARPNALALVAEYLEVLTVELEKFRIHDTSGEEFDEIVVQNIESFLPYRNEAIELFRQLALNDNGDETARIVHRFFEGLIPYLHRPADDHSYRRTDFDNYLFIVHEMFLYAVACFLRFERFTTVASFIETDYYLGSHSSDYGTSMISFEILWQSLSTLGRRNERLGLNRVSLHADLLEQRSHDLSINFGHVMQADLILFFRSRTKSAEAFQSWWPHTLLYATRVPRAFEIFARARSSVYFEKLHALLVLCPANTRG